VRHGAYDNEAARAPRMAPDWFHWESRRRGSGRAPRALPNAEGHRRQHHVARAADGRRLHETLAQVPIETDCLHRNARRHRRARRRADAAHACEQRLDAAYAQCFAPAAGAEETDVLVCHGNDSFTSSWKALAVDATHWLQMTVGNASITVIRVEANGAIHVLSVGDVGHLPPTCRAASAIAIRSSSRPENYAVAGCLMPRR
jgi:broad specificity phosphatase PhoE